jgi:hypothetical protein
MDDLELTREAILDPEMHAIQHDNNLDELNAVWHELDALQGQIDELYKIILEKA